MAKTFAGMEILGELGRGGMGAVYKARHVASGRILALKVMTAGAGGSEKARERFLREARTMARLRHPNIVSVFEVGEAEKKPYLALEFVRGKSLSGVLDEATPDPRQGAAWMAKIVRAVGHAHAHGVIHRDLKPDNVMIHESGEPMVMDFGIAKDALADLRLTAVGTVMGTPSYMSPEQARGQELDARSDIFSLGGILYALLTGLPPFVGPTTAAIMLSVVEDEPKPPTEVNPAAPKELETICFKAMRKSPGDRYQTAEEMAADLDAYLAARPIAAQPETAAEKLVRRARRHRGKLIGAAAALAAVLAITIAAFARPAKEPSAPAPATPTPATAAPQAPSPLGGVDRLVAERKYDEALALCRKAQAETSDAALKSDLEKRAQWLEDLERAAAAPKAAAPPPAAPPSANDALAQELARADQMLVRNEYAQAVTVYERLLAGALDAAQQKNVQQRLTWAKDLRDRAAKPAADPTKATPAASGASLADADRFLAKGRFDDADAIYQKAGTGADAVARRELTAALLALRTSAQQVIAAERRVPVTAGARTLTTVCGIQNGAMVIADAGGTVSARAWDVLKPAEIYEIFRACVRGNAAADHLGLGALCLSLNLRAEAKKECDEAVRLDAAKKTAAERMMSVQLAR